MTTRRPLVTIAMPVFNGGDYFPLALRSALSQTYENIEIIIVDDGSTDSGKTRRNATSTGDSRVIYIHQSNVGVAGALNAAINAMTGDAFCWLSHDDLFEPDKIERQIKYHQRLQRSDAIIFSDYLVIDGDGTVVNKITANRDRLMQAPMLALLTGSINGCTLYIPAHILKNMDPFNVKYRYAQDYQQWNRILRHYEFFHMPSALVRYRVHDQQGSNKPEAITEGDDVWIAMMDDRTEIERVFMLGSSARFFAFIANHLDGSPYRRAHDHARARSDRSAKEAMVSVIIPVERDQPSARETIAALLAQTHAKIEVLVVGPAAASAAFANGDPRIRTVSGEGAKVSAAEMLNTGIAEASGDYLVFVRPGDKRTPLSIGRQLDAMQRGGLLLSHDREGVVYRLTAANLLLGQNPPLDAVMMHRVVTLCGSAGFRNMTLGLGDGAALIPFARRQERLLPGPGTRGGRDAFGVASELNLEPAAVPSELASAGAVPIQPDAEPKLQAPAATLDSATAEQLAAAFIARLPGLPGNHFHKLFDEAGFHLLRKHYYLPVPELGDIGPDDWSRPSAMAGVDMNENAAHELMDVVLPPFLAEFRARFPIHAVPDRKGFHLLNASYMAVDAHLLYGIVRHAKPRRIIEIGNGASTMVAVAAAETNRAEGYPVDVISIDPYPSPAFANGYPGLNELIAKKVQDVPVSLFESLGRNDIFFIDSSHVLRTGNDVQHIYLNLLPIMPDGVYVHVHDISLPMPYPKVYFDIQLYWNEQYLLQAFLMFNSRYKVIWPGNYMMLKCPDKMMTVFPEIADMRAVWKSSEPTAFWMRVGA